VGLVPRGDRVSPAKQRSTEGAHLFWARRVLEVVAELVDELHGELRVVVVVDGAHHLFGVPGQADLASGVTGGEESRELGLALVVEALVGLGEQTTAPVERVVLAPSVPERLVLHAPSVLVELGVGELDHVEGVCDQGRFRQVRLEHQSIGTREVARRIGDLVAPGLATLVQPQRGLLARAALDDVEQLPVLHVDDRGREVALVELAESCEEHLVEPEGVDHAESPGILVDEWLGRRRRRCR